ncbi:MAG: nucleoside hydrolase [Acidobacteria bacterium]|nr:nucleoside hydrolase [Acidobacteriota bacterium]
MRPLAGILVAGMLCVAQPPLIVDTDAGADDLIALLWLLRQPGVRIEAVTVCSGLAHPAAGADTVLRVLEYAGHAGIQVYAGSEKPFRGDAAFPAEWRRQADALFHSELPPVKRKPSAIPAHVFLADRLMDPRQPVRILALGPLTNLGAATAREPRTGAAVAELVWMGGAVSVDGNVPNERSSEWNAFVDPEAAERVIGLGWKKRIVPLDATNQVPITPAILQNFEETAREWDSSIVLRLLRAGAESIRKGQYFAWDLLAAMAAVDPKVLTAQPMAVTVRKRPSERGRLVRVEGARPNAAIATKVDLSRFATRLQELLP